jgi:uncharacterized protein
MTNPLVRLCDLWVRRYADVGPAVLAARAAVAHLKPIIVVTGGSRGLGAALAMRFAIAGHDIAIVAREPEALAATAERIRAATGRNIIALPCDITSPSAPADIDRELAARGYYQDILVNNAGFGLSGPFDGHAAADLDQLTAVNMSAPTRLMRNALKAMRARQLGGLLNVASLGGYVPGPNQAAYYASKSYILSLTEAVGSETRGQGIRITALAPGPLNTRFHGLMGAEDARYRRLLPALSAERAAHIAYRGFTLGRRVIVPGMFNWLLFAGVRAFPHAITVPVTGWLLARHQQK